MSATAERMQIHTVTGGGGLRLHVREWGDPAGAPVLFLHGWSQSHLCWARQYDGRLAERLRLVACDLRGHGMSEAPHDPERYTDGRLWGDDLAAIIEQLGLDRPVLVGWSYGGFVICDYVRAHGQDGIAGIDLVGGAVKLGPSAFGTLIGPAFLDHFGDLTADDLSTNIRGLRAFVRACVAAPLGADDLETAMCSAMAVRPGVRAALGSRVLDYDDVLAKLRVPTLVTQGRADSVVLPAMAEHIVATCAGAEASWYDGVGHAPHLEAPERFNRELAAFVVRVRA